MIISVQIYNFYLRKGKTREENISFVRNKTTDHSLPTEQWTTKISLNCNSDNIRNKNKQTYFSLFFYIAIFASSQQFFKSVIALWLCFKHFYTTVKMIRKTSISTTWKYVKAMLLRKEKAIKMRNIHGAGAIT